jgi:hypothetical protein
MRFLKIERGGNRDTGAVVAPHAIDGYRGFHLVLIKPACCRANGLAPARKAPSAATRLWS